jgi:hypothetical protein
MPAQRRGIGGLKVRMKLYNGHSFPVPRGDRCGNFGVTIICLQIGLLWYSWPRSHAQMVLDNILNPSVIEADQNRSSDPIATHLNRNGEAVG